jgi:hypothetical protein
MTWRVGRVQAKDDGGIVEALNGIRYSTVQGLVVAVPLPRRLVPLQLLPSGCLFRNGYVGCRRDRHKDISWVELARPGMEVCVEKGMHNESARLSYRGYGMNRIMGLSVFVRQDEMTDSILRRRGGESI